MKKVLLALAVVFLVAPPASASAGTIGWALEIAHEQYPQACYPVTVHVGFDDLPSQAERPADMRTLAGWAWIGPDNPCEIWLASDWGRWPWWSQCQVVEHEVGHLAGLGHSDDLNDPMYPSIHHRPECELDPDPQPWRPQMNGSGKWALPAVLRHRHRRRHT